MNKILSITIFWSVLLSGCGTSKKMEVADQDKKIQIWETVAGNDSRSKLGDMKIGSKSNLLLSTIRFIKAIVGEEYKDVEEKVDNFTYLHEIKRGFEKDTYEDEPSLIPYIVDKSNGAVIIIPGGGFAYKSTHGSDNEGKDVAMSLNNAGISAFVLDYRSNPYVFPIPQLDVQRAVRFIKYHAKDFGISPDRIVLLGYSAGGYQTGSFINLIMGKNVFPEGYNIDEIDEMDDSIMAAAMIYPALTYKYNVPMLFSSFDAQKVKNQDSREQLLLQTDLPQHFNSITVPQFISYGTKDRMVDMRGTLDYIDVAISSGNKPTVVVADGADHGYKQKFYMEQLLLWLSDKVN